MANNSYLMVTKQVLLANLYSGSTMFYYSFLQNSWSVTLAWLTCIRCVIPPARPHWLPGCTLTLWGVPLLWGNSGIAIWRTFVQKYHVIDNYIGCTRLICWYPWCCCWLSRLSQQVIRLNLTSRRLIHGSDVVTRPALPIHDLAYQTFYSGCLTDTLW